MKSLGNLQMTGTSDRKELIRDKVAAEHGIQLYRRYSEKHAADKIGCDYSTLKRKRRAGLVPFVDLGGGSVGYMGYHIADIIVFGVKAREQWAGTSDASSNAETGGSASSPGGRDTSDARSKAVRPSGSALALAILMKQKSA